MALRVLLVASCLLFAGCASHSRTAGSADKSAKPVVVTMDTSRGPIVVELDPAHAPLTVANFLRYADSGAYNGTTFHRVVPGFVIQGGGWTRDMTERAKTAAAAGHPDVPIWNEWQNGLKNERGTIAMAREEGPDTATREFFVNLKDNVKLDTAREKTGNAGYAVFGRVIAGMDVVDHIATIQTRGVDVPGVTDGSMENVPVEPIVIRKVRRSR